jgi:putative flippase GtrA
MGLASLLRYQLGFNLMFGSFGGTAAFIFASIAVSIINYILNAKIVFKNGEVCDTD